MKKFLNRPNIKKKHLFILFGGISIGVFAVLIHSQLSIGASQYYTDFREYTTGSAPSDWTEHWNTGDATVTVENSGLPTGAGDQALKVVHGGSTSRYALSWDKVGSLGDVDVQVLFKFQTNINNTNLNQGRLALCIGGTTGSEDSYATAVGTSSFFDGQRGIIKYVNGTSTSLSSSSHAAGGDTWYWVRLERIASTNTIRMRIWEDGDSEPGSWLESTTDSSLSTGYVGFHSITANETMWIDEFSVGVDGGSAPSDPTAPDTPTGLTATTVDHDTIDADWDSDAYADDYDLRYDTDSGFGSPTLVEDIATNSYTIDSLSSDTTYYVQVRACNTSGCSDWSTSDSATTDGPPSTPTGLIATATDHETINADWDTMADTNYYDLRHDTDSGFGSPTLVENISPRSNSDYTMEGLSASTTYYIQVRACNDAGCSSWSASVSETTDPIPVPSTPTGLGGSGIDNDSINWSWESTQYADDYDLQWRKSGESTWNTESDLASTSKTVNSLDTESTYEAQVRACNTSGCSSYSSTETATTDPPPNRLRSDGVQLEGIRLE